jgi:hypothetical protein
MSVSLDLTFDIRKPSAWWKDGRIGRELATALTGNGLWLDFAFAGTAGGRMRPLHAPEEVEDFARKWKPAEYSLQQDPDDDLEAPTLTLSVREGYFAAALLVTGEALEERAARLVESLAGFGKQIFAALAPIATLTLGQTIVSEPYPRPRPPRVTTLGLSPGSLLDFVDLDFLRANGSKKQADAVAKAKLPPGASRERDGRLVVLRWAAEVADLRRVAAARARQERWLVENVGLDRDQNYNEAGDLLVDADGAEEHPPLTYYDPANEIGYKAVVPTAMDAAQWAEIERWAKRGKLPDGSVLSAVRLIVPNRAAALKLRARARETGVKAVLYTDNQGQWWDPSPPGEWAVR